MGKVSMGYRRCFLPLVAIVLISGHPVAEGEGKQPVYVGARVCATCHDGPEMGHQFSLWLLSKHSRAYADLSTPEAKEMAIISGIPGEPMEAMACLGCHATAADSEPWERDPTFRIEDGVQCERCHGPGSEYMDEAIMRDREAAVRAGLKFLSVRECELCHAVKGSHVAVHKRPKLDMTSARETIAHPTPEAPTPGTGLDFVPSKAGAGPRRVGVQVCASCHRGPSMGYQFSRWRLGPHARAYAVLATTEAKKIARRSGVDGDPQKSADCLTCHTTGQPPDELAAEETFWLSDGVGCESCHGAGS